MSDEIDGHTRDERWRRVCPGITGSEIDALDEVREAHGTAVGAQVMLAAYRAGKVAAEPGSAGLRYDQYVTVRMPDGSTVVGKVKYIRGVDGGSILVQADQHGAPLGHRNLHIGLPSLPLDVPLDGPRERTTYPRAEEVTGFREAQQAAQDAVPPFRGAHHRDCTWLGPREGWRCIRGCAKLLDGP